MNSQIVCCVLGLSVILGGCASRHYPGEVLSGCPRLYAGVRDEEALKGELEKAQSEEDLMRIFGQAPTASCIDTNNVKWCFWYATQEWFANNKWNWSGYQITVTLKDGVVVGFNDPCKSEGVCGEFSWNDDSLWCYYRYINPMLSQTADREAGMKYFFNDEEHVYVRAESDKEVDYWEGGTVHWKLPELESDQYRLFATNSLGEELHYDTKTNETYLGFWDDCFHMAPPPAEGCVKLFATNSVGHMVACDMEEDWTYLGYWDESFHFQPSPCLSGLKRIYEGNRFIDIPVDATYLGYWDGVFHYRTREQELARLRREREDNALIVNSVLSGLTTTLTGLCTMNQMAPIVPVPSASRVKRENQRSTEVIKPVSGGLAERKCPRCTTKYVGPHCPVCAAPRFSN